MIPSDFSVLPFRFDNLQVRVMLVGGDPWFVAKDVGLALGYKDTINAVKLHCKYTKSLNDMGVAIYHPYTNQAVNLDPQIKLIPESDVYRLILRSHLPSAERFERWLMEEVLPSIRKTGAYVHLGHPWQHRPSSTEDRPHTPRRHSQYVYVVDHAEYVTHDNLGERFAHINQDRIRRIVIIEFNPDTDKPAAFTTPPADIAATSFETTQDTPPTPPANSPTPPADPASTAKPPASSHCYTLEPENMLGTQMQAKLAAWLEGRDRCTMYEVCVELLGIPAEDITRAGQIRIGCMLKNLGWLAHRETVSPGVRVKVYRPDAPA